MSDRARTIKIFMASPGDHSEYRQEFRLAIGKLHQGLGDGMDISFQALGWEDTYASTGPRVQSVINLDVDQCDIFVLSLFRHWGQDAPDSKYSSYTEEEFHRALARYNKTGAPEIFVFFLRVDPASEADPDEQLQKVMTFRQSLEDTRRVRYRYVGGVEQFGKEVHNHVRAYAKGVLPAADAEGLVTPFPIEAIAAIEEARERLKQALLNVDESQTDTESSMLRADQMALTLAEDAIADLHGGRPERARQRFARLTASTTNTRILSLAAEFYSVTGDLDAAEELLRRCIALDPSSAAAIGSMGGIHRARGELDQAEAMIKAALEIHVEQGNKRGMASNNTNLGLLYSARGDLDRAETKHRLALDLNKEVGSKEGMAASYGNLGIVLKDKGELDEAEEVQRLSLALDKELDNRVGIAATYGNLGIIHNLRGELDEADAMHEDSLTLNKAIENKAGMANCYLNLGNGQMARGNREETRRNWELSAALFEETSSPMAAKVRECIAELANTL